MTLISIGVVFFCFACMVALYAIRQNLIAMRWQLASIIAILLDIPGVQERHKERVEEMQKRFVPE